MMWRCVLTVLAVAAAAQAASKPTLPPGDGGRFGIDTHEPVTQTVAECLVDKGFEYAILRAWRSFDALDSDAVSSVQNARSHGLKTVDVYMFHCRGKSSAEAQVNGVLDAFEAAKTHPGRIWLDVESNPSSGCGWDQFTKADNCQFVRDTIDRIQERGYEAGIYTNKHFWTLLVGSECEDIPNYGSGPNPNVDVASLTSDHPRLTQSVAPPKHRNPLWYAHAGETPDFDDYNRNDKRYTVTAYPQASEGEPGPYIKQYWFDLVLCGVNTDLNWQPASERDDGLLGRALFASFFSAAAIAGGYSYYVYRKKQSVVDGDEKESLEQDPEKAGAIRKLDAALHSHSRSRSRSRSRSGTSNTMPEARRGSGSRRSASRRGSGSRRSSASRRSSGSRGSASKRHGSSS